MIKEEVSKGNRGEGKEGGDRGMDGSRALIGGGCIFIYSCSARLISFEINLISKEISRAEHEYMNMHPPPPQLTL